MSEIENRLRASAKLGAVHGNLRERQVCESQMLEAATEIDRLRSKNERLNEALLGLAHPPQVGYGPCWCGVATGDPRYTEHSAACKAAREALEG